MDYKTAIETIKKYSGFIGKQLHIEEHKEVITIKHVHLCEIIANADKATPKHDYKSLEDLDLHKDNSELLKDKNLDVVIVYEKSISTENKAADFNKKYPLL